MGSLPAAVDVDEDVTRRAVLVDIQQEADVQLQERKVVLFDIIFTMDHQTFYVLHRVLLQEMQIFRISFVRMFQQIISQSFLCRRRHALVILHSDLLEFPSCTTARS